MKNNMNYLGALVKRNVKLFFNDKGVFFTSLITPLILLVLYATFLKNVYKDSFTDALSSGMKISEDIVNGLVGGQLISSILAVSCVTVSFCSNMISVQDKSNGSVWDLFISPVPKWIFALGYYISTLFVSLIVCFAGMGICLVYCGIVGFYMSVFDVLLLALDVVLLVMFGTALSSIINVFLSTQGQISAVGTIISSGYGFICGAYMPISQFSDVLQKILSFFPGTYGTSLVREHSVRGALTALENEGVPAEAISEIRKVVDCDIFFFGNAVQTETKLLVLFATVIALTTVYTFMKRKKR